MTGGEPRKELVLTLPIFLSVKTSVHMSGMSRSSIYEALKRGDLTARKAGRRTLIAYSDLKAYLDALPEYRGGI